MGSFKKTLTQDEFVKEFKDSSRSSNFSFESLRWLYDYYTGDPEDGNDIELDIIAICCDWSEYTKDELIREYGSISAAAKSCELVAAIKKWMPEYRTDKKIFLVKK
jgi:hypothetical protein